MAVKNPYRNLAIKLRALPPERRTLTTVRTHAWIDDVRCGCALGSVYPDERPFHTNSLAALYGHGASVPEEPNAHDLRAREFYQWIHGLGGDYDFVCEITTTNDLFREFDNYKEARVARYEYMLKYLDAKAVDHDTR